ncbi:permease [Muriicola marianensis]|uniref:Permease n=1 Tax=Muriicola marianensis TaxID=1324801 RepID=A0ABQ1R1T4_9FLAO|nr:permease [Muriicola marianensis]
MSDVNRKWVYLVILSIIWGTSYILIKKGLEGFTPVQLGAVRIVITSVVLLSLGFRSLRSISGKEWFWVGLSGLLGSFLPVFLFAFAETEIDSSIAAILNSLVPLFTILIGFAAFGITFSKRQLGGVLVGLLGAVLLIALGSEINPGQNYWYAGLVVLATIFYACNANIIKSKLQEVSAMGIAVGNFAFMIVPALFLLFYSGALSSSVRQGEYFMSSLGYVAILSIIGTCVAKVMFNRLIQISSPVFSVSVTYLIPVVGIFWGLMDGERFSLWQVFAAGIILIGVYLVNKKKSTSRK